MYRWSFLYWFLQWSSLPKSKIGFPYLTLSWLLFQCFFVKRRFLRRNTYFVLTWMILVFRFFRHLLVLFLIHTGALSLFRCVASYCQTMVAGSVGGTMSFLVILLFGGFIIPRCKTLPYFRTLYIARKRWVLISYKSKHRWHFPCRIATASMPNWLKWGFWLSPLSYAEIGLTGNEFLAPRWLKVHIDIVTLN